MVYTLRSREYKYLLIGFLLCVLVALFSLYFLRDNPKQLEQSIRFTEEFQMIEARLRAGGSVEELAEEIRQKNDTLAAMAYKIGLASYYADNSPHSIHENTNLFHEAVESAKAYGDASLFVFALAQRGYYYYQQRKISQAMPDMIEVVFRLERYPEMKPPFEQKVYKQIGFFLGTIGDFEKANKFLQHSLALTDTSARREQAALLDNIGLYTLELKDTLHALHYFEDAQSLARRGKDDVRQAKILGNLARIEWGRGDREQAMGSLKADIEISLKEKDSLNSLYATNMLAEFMLEEGQVATAHHYLMRIRPFAEKHQHLIVHRNKLHQLLLEVSLRQGNTSEEFIQRRILYNMQDSLNLFDGENVTKKASWQAERQMIRQRLAQSNMEYTKEKQKSRFLMVLGLSVVSLLISLYLLMHVRNKKEKAAFSQWAHRREAETEKVAIRQKQGAWPAPISPSPLSPLIQQAKRDKLQQLLTAGLITNERWRTFKHVFADTYPEAYEEMTLEFPELSESNLRISILEKLDFCTVEISDLLGVTPGAIKKSKQRLRKKMGEERYVHFRNVVNKTPEDSSPLV